MNFLEGTQFNTENYLIPSFLVWLDYLRSLKHNRKEGERVVTESKFLDLEHA